MLAYLGRRVLVAIPTLLLVSIFVFTLQKLLPGDPVLVLAGEERDPEVLKFLREKYRLNDPVIFQYFYWLGGVLTGDMGISLRTNQPVTTLIAQKLPVTIQLGVMSMIFAFLVGIPAGILSAAKKGTWTDYVANIIALSGLSIPNFWLGIMLILLVSVNLGWLPASGYEPFFDDPVQSLQTMIMPAFVLGTALAAALMRHTRSSMLGVLEADYVRTARAKGLRPFTVLFKHALRNAIIPVVSLAAVQFGFMLGGSIVIETIFAINGLGFLAWESIQRADLPMMQAIVLVLSIFYIFLTFFADMLNAFLDPRIRVA